jgi:hypothetical protein
MNVTGSGMMVIGGLEHPHVETVPESPAPCSRRMDDHLTPVHCAVLLTRLRSGGGRGAVGKRWKCPLNR